MNIYDVYIVGVCILKDINYNKRPTYRYEYTRDALVLVQQKYNRVRYYDLFLNEEIKSAVVDCRIGEEIIAKDYRYEPITKYIEENEFGKPNLSKRKIIKIIEKSVKKKERTI